MIKEREKQIKAILKHLDGKPAAYRTSFENLLGSGGEWCEKTETFECFGRIIRISKNGELDEL